MKIGIISDTHNNIEMTIRAIEIFSEREVDFIVHAGDLTSPRMLELFKDFECIFVLGNGDIDEDIINDKAKSLNFDPVNKSAVFEKCGKKFIVFHGNDVPMFREAVATGEYNYIIKGHTHFFENYISNKARIINPGALYSSDESSIAILDCEADRVEMIRIEEE